MPLVIKDRQGIGTLNVNAGIITSSKSDTFDRTIVTLRKVFMRYVFVVLITATAIINDGLANAATARISAFKLAKDPVKVTAL